MKKIDELKTKISEANERIKELKKQVQKELQAEFNGALTELFDAYPFVTSLSFTAYTPYFNDGDTCKYEVHHNYCQFNGYDEDRDDDDQEGGSVNVLKLAGETIYVEEPNPDYDPSKGGWGTRSSKTHWVKKPNPDFNPLYKEAVDAFRSALAIVDNDNWMDMVGDHVRVMITREGIETDEYNHD
jgi:hypothetical protein